MLRPTLAFCAALIGSCCVGGPLVEPTEQRAAYGHSRPAFFSSSPGHSDLLFSANDGFHGVELWRLSGQGAHLVEDINAGSLGQEPRRSSHPDQITRASASGPKAFFVARSHYQGRELWYYDGRDVKLVKDIRLGRRGCMPSGLHMFQNRVVFSADDGINGRELWWSDGSTAGMVEIARGKASSFPAGFTEFQGRLYFSAQDADGDHELRWYDGTKHDVVNVDPDGSSAPDQLTVWNGELWFSARITSKGRGLFRHDGRSAPVRVELGLPSHLTPGPDHLALTALNADGKRQLYLLDKRGARPREKTSFERGHSIHDLTWADSDLFFVADGRPKKVEGEQAAASMADLWIIGDQGRAEPQRVSSVPAGSAPKHLTAFAGGLLFSARDAEHGSEPWVWDRKTRKARVMDIRPGAAEHGRAFSSSPSPFVPMGRDQFFFAADGPGGREVWVTDGETAEEEVDIDPAEPELPLLKVWVEPVNNVMKLEIEDARPGVLCNLMFKLHGVGELTTYEFVRGAVMVEPPDITVPLGHIGPDGSRAINIPVPDPEVVEGEEGAALGHGEGTRPSMAIQGVTGPGSEVVATAVTYCTSGSATVGGATITVEGCVNDHDRTWHTSIVHGGGARVFLRLVKFTPDEDGSETGFREFLTEGVGDLPLHLDPEDAPAEDPKESEGGPVLFEMPAIPDDPDSGLLELWIFEEDPPAGFNNTHSPTNPPPGGGRAWKSYC